MNKLPPATRRRLPAYRAPLGPRASRPHRVCRGFRNSPCLLDPPWPAPSRQDAGAPSVPGSRLAAFPVPSFDRSCTFEAPTSSSMRFAALTASYRSYSAG